MMDTILRPAPGIEVHQKQCPDDERTLRFLVCYSSNGQCWYTQRGVTTLAGAAQVVRRLRKAHGGRFLDLKRFRIWDTTRSWPA